MHLRLRAFVILTASLLSLLLLGCVEMPNDLKPATSEPETPEPEIPPSVATNNVVITANEWKLANLPDLESNAQIHHIVHGPFWIGAMYGVPPYVLYSLDGETWAKSEQFGCSSWKGMPRSDSGSLAANDNVIVMNVRQHAGLRGDVEALVYSSQISQNGSPVWNQTCEYSLFPTAAPLPDSPTSPPQRLQTSHPHWVSGAGFIVPARDRSGMHLVRSDTGIGPWRKQALPAANDPPYEVFIRSGGRESDWLSGASQYTLERALVNQTRTRSASIPGILIVQSWRLVYRTTDGGNSWTLHRPTGDCGAGAPDWFIEGVTASEDRFFAVVNTTLSNSPDAVDSARLCESNDGISWRKLSNAGIRIGIGALEIATDDDGQTVVFLAGSPHGHRNTYLYGGVYSVATTEGSAWNFTPYESFNVIADSTRFGFNGVSWGSDRFVMWGKVGDRVLILYKGEQE